MLIQATNFVFVGFLAEVETTYETLVKTDRNSQKHKRKSDSGLC